MKKLYMLISILVASTTFSFSQITKEWDKTLGGNSKDKLFAIQPTSDGGFLLAGSSNSNIGGDKTENSKGGEDYWVVKIDGDGKKLWDKTFGGDKYDELSTMQPTSDGGFLLAGRSSSDVSGDKTENSKGGYDYWVVKIDGGGNKLWDKTFGGNKEDELSAVQPTSDGGFLLAGRSTSDASGDKTENSKGKYDYWIVKVDGDGNKKWDKTLGGNKDDQLLGVQSTMDGGFLLGGWSESGASGDKTENPKGEYDYWVVKVDGGGNKKWDKTFGGDMYDILVAIQPTSDGGFLLAGWSDSGISGDKTASRKGANDYWVVKIDGDGNKLWDKTFGGRIFDALYTIQSTNDGGFLLGGSSASDISGDKTEDRKGYDDYWVVKIDGDGNKQWDKAFGGSGFDDLIAIQPTSDGGFLLAGWSDSDISGDKTENSRGTSTDYWIVKMKQSPTKPIFSVYPTIGSLDCLFIDSSDPTYLPATVTILQLMFPFGIVISQPVTTIHECIDVSKLPAGIYLVTITDAKGGIYKTRIRIL